MARYKEYNTGQQHFEVININRELPLDNRARIIKEIVNGLELSGFDLNYRNDEKGAKANDVQMMLGILFLAAARGIRGSRSIAASMASDIEFKYILDGARAPEASTIRKFRSRHVKEYSMIFAKIVHIACALGMVDFGALAIDGTKVQAYASLYETKDIKGFEKSIKILSKRLEDILNRLNNTADSEERAELEKRRFSIDKRQAVLADFRVILNNLPAGERINRVDSDARLMRTKDGKSIIGYNAQAAVETGEHGIITAAELSQQATDETLLLEMGEKAEENCSDKFDALLGDAGYITYESMEAATRKGKKILGPDRLYDKERFGKDKKNDFIKSKFQYDSENDRYACPGNHYLEFQRMIETKTSPLIYEYSNKKACAGCKFRPDCFSKSHKCRIIQRDYREPLREKMRAELQSTGGFLLYAKRSQTVETAFGNVKQNKGVRQFYYRGLEKAAAEWKHICNGINISKIVKFLQGKDWNSILNTALAQV